MNKIHVLDCTLRDGGYCNQWKFESDNIHKIVRSLVDADIDIIECGFLTNIVVYNKDITMFTDLSEIAAVIPRDRKGKLFVAMMNYGEYSVDDIPENDGSSIDGIRVAFHKKDLKEALSACRVIKKKGYKVFVQAMVSLSYTDEEFLSLIHVVNEIQAYAFYIVDSFGMMKQKNLFRLFYMVENNLIEDIWIGFHSHNNMQLSYSNAQGLVDAQTNRNLIIDSSIYGMGRGAGNLNTELFVEYLNENVNGSYDLKPLLNVIDEILNNFYQKNYWGYSLPNYLSAKHWTHPNYASYFSEKNTLTVEAMNEIFSIMPKEKKLEFDKAYAEQIYVQYMARGVAQEKHEIELKEKLREKKIMLLAPGRSTEEEREKIVKFVTDNRAVLICVNHEYPYIESDFIFLSNLRRFRELDKSKYNKCIITSNIPAERVYIQTKYHDLLNSFEAIGDNAGMMAIQYLINMGVKKVYLAGFDGYSHDVEQNYASRQMTIITRNDITDIMNHGMKEAINSFKEEIEVVFFTQPRFNLS